MSTLLPPHAGQIVLYRTCSHDRAMNVTHPYRPMVVTEVHSAKRVSGVVLAALPPVGAGAPDLFRRTSVNDCAFPVRNVLRGGDMGDWIHLDLPPADGYAPPESGA